jgi:RHS repeat-associated protein
MPARVDVLLITAAEGEDDAARPVDADGRERYLARRWSAVQSEEWPYVIWTEAPNAVWTDYLGQTPYGDYSVDMTTGTPELTETSRYLFGLGAHAQDTLGQSGSTVFLHGDLIGSTMLTVDAAGQVVETPVYTAFGEPVSGGVVGQPPSAAVTRYGYAGSWGYESGLLTVQGANTSLPPITLQHVGERWYQPAIGRFVQRDPIGIRGGKNLYAYCANEPLGGIDPTGLAGARDPFPYYPHPYPGEGFLTHPVTKAGGFVLTVGAIVTAVTPVSPGVVVCLGIAGVTFQSGGDLYGAAHWSEEWIWRHFWPHTPEPNPPAPVHTGGDDCQYYTGSPYGCFPAGTTVVTPLGSVPIELFGTDDPLWVRDIFGGIGTCCRAVLVETGAADVLVEIDVGCETLTCTRRHPLWVVGQGWTAAEDLLPGSELLTRNAAIYVRDIRCIPLVTPAPVYNILLPAGSGFYVGACEVLVHGNQLPPHADEQLGIPQMAFK